MKEKEKELKVKHETEVIHKIEVKKVVNENVG
jgi:activator of HSP90 ATPase